MCGLFAINSDELPPKIIKDVSESLQIRGVDGVNYIAKNGFTIFQSRLAITGVTNGLQPFEHEACCSIVNGEIYNYRDVVSRHNLDPDTLSDCEVLPLLYRKNGIRGIRELIGMFAFVIHDRDKGLVYFGRDPVGEKPLFYHFYDGQLSIGSTLNLFTKVHNFQISKKGIKESLLLNFNLDETPLNGVKNCEPGQIYVYDGSDVRKLEQAYQPIKAEPTQISFPDYCLKFRELFLKNLGRIVEHGDFSPAISLSGGLDSSLIASAVSRYFGSSDLYCLSNASATKNDETRQAEQLAVSLDNAKFDYVPATQEDLMESWVHSVVSRDSFTSDATGAGLQFFYDSLSQRGVKVVISGIGGDELFLDYPWVRSALKLRMFNNLSFKQSLSAAYSRYQFISHGNIWRCRPYAHYLKKSGLFFKSDVGRSKFKTLSEIKTALNGYMVNNGLIQNDSIALASGIEVRSPLACEELVSFCMNHRCEEIERAVEPKKLVYRAAFSDLIPEEVFLRPKSGFTTALSTHSIPVRDFFIQQINCTLLKDLEIIKPGFSLVNVNTAVLRHLAHISVQIKTWGL